MCLVLVVGNLDEQKQNFFDRFSIFNFLIHSNNFSREFFHYGFSGDLEREAVDGKTF